MEKDTPLVTTAPTPRLLALTKVLALVAQIRKEPEPHLVAMSEEERKHGTPVPVALPKVGAEVLQAGEGKPGLETLVPTYDPEMVAQRIAEGLSLASLSNQLESLVRGVGDTRNVGHAAAFRSLLDLYSVVKPLSEVDVSYVPVARPLSVLFEERVQTRGKKGGTDAEVDGS